jgi:hypothetical protein
LISLRQAEIRAENEAWKALVSGFVHDSLEEMRAYVPVSIYKSTVSSLIQESGYSEVLAKRLINKKCLWLVRMAREDIAKIHPSDLNGKFNPIAQGLDAVEIGALLGAFPEKFNSDPDGRKQTLRVTLEQSLKTVWKQQGCLSQPFGEGRESFRDKVRKIRHTAYTNQMPAFLSRRTLHHVDTVSPTSPLRQQLTAEERISCIREQTSFVSSLSLTAPEPGITAERSQELTEVSSPLFGVSSVSDDEMRPNVRSIVKKLSSINQTIPVFKNSKG